MLVRIKVCEIDFCTFHLMGEKKSKVYFNGNWE